MNVNKILTLSSAVPKRVAAGVVALLFALVFGLSNLAYAATLSNASVTLSSGETDATGVEYDLQASNVTTSGIQCIRFEFDTASDGSGGLPSGMSLASAALDDTNTDYIPTPGSWTEDLTGAASGVIEVTGTSQTPASASDRNIVWDNITNGDTSGTGYFLLVNTYNNTDCSSSPVDSAVVQFIFTDGQTVTLTVDPSFTFSVASVAGSQSVNGATTSVATTSTTIPFGSPTTTANSIAAQDLTITTNAQNGFNIYAQAFNASATPAGALWNGSSAIPFHAGTEGTPTAFPETANDEDFGFTTNDADIAGDPYDVGGTGDLWAGAALGSAQNLVATDTAAAGSGDTTRVGYQAGIATTTPTGNYSTTIVYTAVPTY